MTHDSSSSTTTPIELAKFTFRAFESGDGLGLAAVIHPTVLRSLHRQLIEAIAAALELRRRAEDLDDVPSGGIALLGNIGDLNMLQLRGERLDRIAGISTFGELLDLDVESFFDRTIRAQAEFLKPDAWASFEVGESVEIDGEWAAVPYRCTELGRTKDNVLRARHEGSRWLVWSAPDLIVHWPVFVPPL